MNTNHDDTTDASQQSPSRADRIRKVDEAVIRRSNARRARETEEAKKGTPQKPLQPKPLRPKSLPLKRPITNSKETKKLTILLDLDLLTKFKIQALTENVNFSRLAAKAIQIYLNTRGEQERPRKKLALHKPQESDPIPLP